jgi:hypothetical protein
MKHEVQILIEPHGPPAPARKPPSGRPQVEYPFHLLEAGGPPARIARSASTVRQAMHRYLKTPAGAGCKFVIRPITPAMCRIWRTQ